MALPGNLTPPRGSRDDASIVPYRGLRCGKVAVSRLAAGLPLIVGAGFIPPRAFAVPRGVRDDASIVPYMGLRCDKVAVSRLVVYPTIDRRGGFHIRPQTFAPPRGAAG